MLQQCLSWKGRQRIHAALLTHPVCFLLSDQLVNKEFPKPRKAASVVTSSPLRRKSEAESDFNLLCLHSFLAGPVTKGEKRLPCPQVPQGLSSFLSELIKNR